MFELGISTVGSVNVMTSDKGGLTNEQVAEKLSLQISFCCFSLQWRLLQLELWQGSQNVSDSFQATRNQTNV